MLTLHSRFAFVPIYIEPFKNLVFPFPFHAAARSDSIDEPFHANANGTAATPRERDEEHRQLARLHNFHAARLTDKVGAKARGILQVRTTVPNRTFPLVAPPSHDPSILSSAISPHPRPLA